MSVLSDTQELAAKAVNILIKAQRFGGYPKRYCVMVCGNIESVGSHSALMRLTERAGVSSLSFPMRSSASHQ